MSNLLGSAGATCRTSIAKEFRSKGLVYVCGESATKSAKEASISTSACNIDVSTSIKSQASLVFIMFTDRKKANKWPQENYTGSLTTLSVRAKKESILTRTVSRTDVRRSSRHEVREKEIG
jgi:hypothetical protein